MDATVALWSALIAISLMLLAAGSAVVAWKLASRSTQSRKSPPSSPVTPISDAKLAAVQQDVTELFSTLAKLNTTVRRLSSRQGMQDVRERQATQAATEAPPLGTPKSELLRHYGLIGKHGPQFAQAQLDIEHDQTKERTN